MNPRIVLASGSPRRAAILAQLGLAPDIVAADVDETYVAGESPVEHVERLARAKALAVALGRNDALIVAGQQESQGAGSDVALTPRELEVLALLAEGASNKLIGRRLGISAHTAKYHVASLLEKLDAVSRTDAVAHAARIGVLHL